MTATCIQPPGAAQRSSTTRAADGADEHEVDADDEGADGGTGDGHLNPAPRRRAEVEHGARRRDEPEAVVELLQLEGRVAPVALLLGEVVVLVLPLLPLRLAHGALDLHRQRWLAAHKLLDRMLHRNRDGMKMIM